MLIYSRRRLGGNRPGFYSESVFDVHVRGILICSAFSRSIVTRHLFGWRVLCQSSPSLDQTIGSMTSTRASSTSSRCFKIEDRLQLHRANRNPKRPMRPGLLLRHMHRRRAHLYLNQCVLTPRPRGLSGRNVSARPSRLGCDDPSESVVPPLGVFCSKNATASIGRIADQGEQPLALSGP